MPSDKDWAGRYKGSDHHIDRYVRNKLNYEFKTGAPYPAPDPWEEKDKGREQGFHSPDNMVVVTTRRCRSVPPSVVELNYDYGYGPASRKAHRISQYMTDDQDAIRSASRRQDAALLRNITSRMYRLDFETVKPDSEISKKTGFRKLIYQPKRVFLEKDFKEERRKDRLRYPWDYTQDNVYHKKPKPKQVDKKKMCLFDRLNYKEPEPKDPYPEYDPFGIYRPRPKREHKSIEESKAEKDVKCMAISEMLVKARAKAALAKTEVDPADEDDILFERFINRPLPKSDVATYVPATGNLYDFTTSYRDSEELDPAISKKIKDSRSELADFEHMLDSKFSQKKHKFMNPVAPPLVKGPKRSSALFALAVPEAPIFREADVERDDTAADTEQDTADYRGVGVDYRTPIHVPRRARAHSPVITHISRSGRASSVPRNFRESQYEEEEFFLPRGRARLMEVPRWEDWTPYFYKPITSYVSHQVRHRAGSEPPVDRRAHVHVAAHVPTFSTAYVSPAQRYTTPSVDLAVRQARGALGRLERELGSGWEDPYYYEEEHVHRPVRPYSQASFERVTTVPAPRSYSPTMRTHYSPVIPRRSRVADIEASLEATYMPETMSTYAGLRSRAAEARSKVDMHKTMMDRYLPIHLGPEKDVGMPQLERYRPSTVPSKVTPTPYRPVSRPERRMSLPSTPTRVVAAAPPRRAPMSDARKRAREVLCKTKRDPEYYSY